VGVKIKNNAIQDKSYSFALSIVKLYQKLSYEKREYVLSRQLLKSGTSIGANVEEALAASSRKDFIHKMSISLREARESMYWIRLLKDSNYIQPDEAVILLNNAYELVRLLSSIVKTSKQNK
jgi:four helix bundle protein